MATEFSFRTRKDALESFKKDVFDFLIIGGGITGAAVAHDAALRGLKVALVEKSDFAYGTSSRSSKLIHGGLRYLENMEFGLVFEALSERDYLLKTAPTMVKPLPFYLPIYSDNKRGPLILRLGLSLYDLLALFKTPGRHKKLSSRELREMIPFLRSEGLVCGFSYFDASMWDDVLVVKTLRAAQKAGAMVANYVEAIEPLWETSGCEDSARQIRGFCVRDAEAGCLMNIRAKRVIVCAGPWTDKIGAMLSSGANGGWRNWLSPSKGVHILFDLKKLPVPGAVVMDQKEDGRIAFAIPRPDFGAGVTIVGTTDGPSPSDPDQAAVEAHEVEYLMQLVRSYFGKLDLGYRDIISSYVGVRPLAAEVSKGDDAEKTVLQKVSREHHIAEGPGGSVIVAGGKYTTHRTMAEEIVDFTLKLENLSLPPKTSTPLEPRYIASELDGRTAADDGLPGFPQLEAQLRYSVRNEMVMHLEDFYFRRVPLYLARADHGVPWAERLAYVLADELGSARDGEPRVDVLAEVERLKATVAQCERWRKKDLL
ncbi:MAG: glycerol-3-phosphate dehydrogenase/oxidase [Bdellovibrionota bacterium]